MEHTNSTVTSQVITKDYPTPANHPNDVNFEVKYPEDYKGPRNMKQGIHVMSREVGLMFEQRGIGKIVSADTPAVPEETTEVKKPEEVTEETKPDYSKLNVEELKGLLNDRQIAFDKQDKKPDLIQRLVSADTPAVE